MRIKTLLLLLSGITILIMYSILSMAFIGMGYNFCGGIFVVLALVGGSLSAYLIAHGGDDE